MQRITRAALLLTFTIAATALWLVAHPGRASAAPTRAAASVDRRFQISIASDGSWIILDTESGQFERWVRDGSAFIVTSYQVRSTNGSTRRVTDPNFAR